MNLSLFTNTFGMVHESIPQFIRLEQMLASFMKDEADVRWMKQVLCTRVSKETCTERQQLFSDLRKANARKHFKEIYRYVCDYLRSMERYAHFEGDFYAPLFFLEALSAYFQLIEQIANTPNDMYKSSLMQDLVNTCHAQICLAEYQQVRQAWKQLQLAETCQTGVQIDFKKRDRIFPASSFVTGVTQSSASMLEDFANILDIPTTVRPGLTRLPGEVYRQLFVQSESYFGQVQAFYERYKTLNLLTVHVDQQSFRFFISMDMIFTRMEDRGLPLCLPGVSDERDFYLEDIYDLSLLSQNNAEIVLNSFHYHNPQNVFIVSGANGGGKTCFLRAVCWCVFLASCGCYIPARRGVVPSELTLYAFVGIQESSQSGIYVQEQKFIEEILKETNARTMLFLNEIMIGTGSLKASRELGHITESLIRQSAWLFCATHNYAYVDWVAHTYPEITMLQPVLQGERHERTYRIQQITRENRSYSRDILQKYGLLPEDLEVKCL